MGDGLWEVRSRLPLSRSARILFCRMHGGVVIPQGFMKKTNKTATVDLDLARPLSSLVPFVKHEEVGTPADRSRER